MRFALLFLVLLSPLLLLTYFFVLSSSATLPLEAPASSCVAPLACLDPAPCLSPPEVSWCSHFLSVSLAVGSAFCIGTGSLILHFDGDVFQGLALLGSGFVLGIASLISMGVDPVSSLVDISSLDPCTSYLSNSYLPSHIIIDSFPLASPSSFASQLTIGPSPLSPHLIIEAAPVQLLIECAPTVSNLSVSRQLAIEAPPVLLLIEAAPILLSTLSPSTEIPYSPFSCSPLPITASCPDRWPPRYALPVDTSWGPCLPLHFLKSRPFLVDNGEVLSKVFYSRSEGAISVIGVPPMHPNVLNFFTNFTRGECIIIWFLTQNSNLFGGEVSELVRETRTGYILTGLESELVGIRGGTIALIEIDFLQLTHGGREGPLRRPGSGSPCADIRDWFVNFRHLTPSFSSRSNAEWLSLRSGR